MSRFLNVAAASLMMLLSIAVAADAADKSGKGSKLIEPATQPSGGFKAVVPLGMLLGRPASQPEGTRNIVSYELGQCFQLDRTHCLLVASMDEQGGPDLCVGNDAFIFSKLSDIRADKAIPINRGQANYKVPGQDGNFFLAKYPASGFFVPLGALMDDGRPHPAAGTGLLTSVCVPYHGDRSDPTGAGKTQEEAQVENWTEMVELIPISWDGAKLTVGQARIVPEFLGRQVLDHPFSNMVAMDKGFVGPFRFADQKHHVVRFDWDGNAWAPSKIGEAFLEAKGESEPAIARDGDRYLVTTRGRDAKGRMYASSDGLNFQFLFDWPNTYSPRTLNKGLDGSLYLAANRNPGWFRNPLLAYPMIGNGFGEGVIIHDQSGVRDDNGDKLPFVDHPLGCNLFLEGRWRHLLLFRVCDLKERTFYGFQKDMIKKVHGDTGPIPKRLSSGLYAAEMLYDKVTTPPFAFAEEK